MDLVSSCKDKLAYFRIKELKDVLTQLGLAKQGKKQELVDRILAALSDDPASKMHSWSKRNSIGKEGVEKIIDDIYRKMQDPGATELASKGHISSDISNLKPKEEVEDSFPLEKVRCPCGNSFLSESTIQCEDPRCHVWQHIRCVILPEKPMDGAPPVPPQFYCEICRINRADPFWVTVAHPLYPVKLTSTNVPTDGTNPMQSVEKTFQLTRADRDLLQKTEYDVQAWCILLNDKVPFRMQWPQYADLQVNGVPVRTVNRPGSQLLGANGRDDGPAITTCTREGLNKISLSGCDARIFCLGVRLVKRRSVQQVLNLIPKEPDGEHFEEALARVRRCVGGGTAADNADSDSDLEVVADYITVNLRCPNSGSRIKVAGRFKPCVHMACFDLETFVELNQRSRKWQCPICLKNYSLDNIIIDPYFNRITTMMRYCGEDIAEIDVKTDGFWRVKNEIEHSDLAQWHFPDGTLCVATDGDVKPILETTKQVNQEGGSAGHISLKLGIKKNRNGFWEVSKPEDVRAVSSANQLQEKSGNPCQKVIPMSSSATGSSRDGEDPSVNQDGGGNFDFSTNNGNELNSISRDFDPKYGVANGDLSALGHHDVIVLSDSDDENDNLISHDIVYETGQADAGEIPFSVSTSAVANSFHEVPALVTGGSSCLGLFNDDDDNFELPLWPLRSGTQAGSGFQLFGSDTDVTDALVNVQHSSVTCPMQMNDYSLASGSAMEAATLVQGSSICRSSCDMNDGLVDNPLAFGGDDPYLQIFLPTQPAIAPLQSDLRDQNDTSNGIRTEDWISLRLGDGSGAGHSESATVNGSTPRNYSAIVNGPTPRNEFASEAVGIDSLSNNASLLLGVNDRGSDSMPAMTPANKQRSDSPFSYPRQPRSVRQRTYLSISDSE